MLSIGKAAKKAGVHEQTLRRWEATGKIKACRTATNQRRYEIAEIEKVICENKRELNIEVPNRRKIIYCRVSSTHQKEDLERQKEYMRTRYPDHELFSDISSGTHYQRPGIRKVLELVMQGVVEEIAVASKDRAGRFGFDLFELLLKKYDCKLVIANAQINEDLSPQVELADDLLAIVTSFAARANGRRKYRINPTGANENDDTDNINATVQGMDEINEEDL